MGAAEQPSEGTHPTPRKRRGKRPERTGRQCPSFSKRRRPKNRGGRESNMPRGDGTGPLGQGPMTGRGLGYCAGYNMPGFANPEGYGNGRGMAWGRGGGGGRGLAFRRGRGGFFPGFAGVVPPAAVNEETVLKSQVTALEQQLAALKARLGEIEKDSTE